jgi:hypothetical protein
MSRPDFFTPKSAVCRSVCPILCPAHHRPRKRGNAPRLSPGESRITDTIGTRRRPNSPNYGVVSFGTPVLIEGGGVRPHFVFGVLYLHVGIGIGLGIVSNGHALRGWKGNIGQIGHVQIDPAGPLCHCGKRGCLEAYCTADAILRDARIATLNRDHPAGSVLPNLPHRIEDIMRSADPIFVEVLRQAAKRLGTALGEAIAILEPELVLLGGEMLHPLGDSFVETLVLEIPKSAMPTKPLPPVKSSSFGADAGAIGAATLVLHDAYAPSPQLLNLI